MPRSLEGHTRLSCWHPSPIFGFKAAPGSRPSLPQRGVITNASCGTIAPRRKGAAAGRHDDPNAALGPLHQLPTTPARLIVWSRKDAGDGATVVSGGQSPGPCRPSFFASPQSSPNVRPECPPPCYREGDLLDPVVTIHAFSMAREKQSIGPMPPTIPISWPCRPALWTRPDVHRASSTRQAGWDAVYVLDQTAGRFDPSSLRGLQQSGLGPMNMAGRESEIYMPQPSHFRAAVTVRPTTPIAAAAAAHPRGR